MSLEEALRSSEKIGRVPPHDIEAEMAVLGSILLDHEALVDQVDTLLPESFYHTRHQKIFSAMLALYEEGRPVDLIVLRDRLQKHNMLEDVGGVAYLSQLAEVVPSSANVSYYAHIIQEKGYRRSLIQTCNTILRQCYLEQNALDDLLDKAEQAVFQITQRHISTPSAHINTILKDTLSRIEEKDMSGVLTGFYDLDDLTCGFHASEFIVIAGRPSMGKTSFAMNIIENIAIQRDVPVLLFSLEVTKEQLAQNMLCSRARIDSHKLRKGFVSDQEWQRLTMAAGRLSECPIYIDDSPGLNLHELRAKARKLHAQKHLGLVVLDYMQLMTPPRAESRQSEVSMISRGMKQLARELSVPVVALCQLNRAVETREGHRPRMSDLRESGSIEQDADVVILLHREEYYQKDKAKGEAQVIIAKQRHGPTGTVKLAFLQDFIRFENLAAQGG